MIVLSNDTDDVPEQIRGNRRFEFDLFEEAYLKLRIECCCGTCREMVMIDDIEEFDDIRNVIHKMLRTPCGRRWSIRQEC
jgi:hypothetical protein